MDEILVRAVVDQLGTTPTIDRPTLRAQLVREYGHEPGFAVSPGSGLEVGWINGWVTWGKPMTGTFHPFAIPGILRRQLDTSYVPPHTQFVVIGGGKDMGSWHATLGEHTWRMQFGDTTVMQSLNSRGLDPLPKVAARVTGVSLFVSASDWKRVNKAQRDALCTAGWKGWKVLVWHESVSEIEY